MSEPESMWVHFVSLGLPIVVTIVGTVSVAAWHLSRKIGSFTTLFREYRLHIHGEVEGPLHAERIIYPRTKLNGD